SDLYAGLRSSRGRRIHRGRRAVVRRNLRAASDRTAPGTRCGDHHGTDRIDRAADHGHLRTDRAAAEFRQHHRPAAVVRYRSGVPYLLRNVLALGRLAPPDIEPGAGGILQRARDRDRFRQPLGLEPSGNGQHGEAADDISALDPHLGAALPTGADGPSEPEKRDARSYFMRPSLTLVKCASRVGAPPAANAAVKSVRRKASSLTPSEMTSTIFQLPSTSCIR